VAASDAALAHAYGPHRFLVLDTRADIQLGMGDKDAVALFDDVEAHVPGRRPHALDGVADRDLAPPRATQSDGGGLVSWRAPLPSAFIVQTCSTPDRLL